MSYTAPNRFLMPARHSIDSAGNAWMPPVTFNVPAAWPSANLAIYVPLSVPTTCVLRTLWCGSGAVGTGNVDMALYNNAGAVVVAATAAAKSASAIEQVFDVTDTTLSPGLYYIGLASDSATDQFYRHTSTAPLPAAYGILTEASAYPLPSTATWAVDQTLTYIPLVGMFLEATTA